MIQDLIDTISTALPRRKQKKEGPNYLEMTPIRAYGHELFHDEESGQECVMILIPRFKSKFINSRIKKPYVRASLDATGSQVWLLIDGKSTIAQIAARLQEISGGTLEQTGDRVTMFLIHLHRSEFITFKEFRKG